MLWCKLLLPGAVKRIYNLQSKQLIKLFARLLLQDEDAMLEHLEQGDVAETISVFFEKSVAVSPCATKSVLTIQDVSSNWMIRKESKKIGSNFWGARKSHGLLIRKLSNSDMRDFRFSFATD